MCLIVKPALLIRRQVGVLQCLVLSLDSTLTESPLLLLLSLSTFLRSLSATPLPDRHCDVLVIIDT